MIESPRGRTEALAAATKFVDEVAPRRNERGYTDGMIKAAERVELVLRVATWLLDDTEAIEAAAR